MKRSCCLWLACLAFMTSAAADTVWHCSRMAVSDRAMLDKQAPADAFSLAGQAEAEAEIDDVIRISVMDLINVYSGVSVRLSNWALSACFMPVNDPETKRALQALGLSADVFSALARKSAIANNHLYRVADEEEMKACMARHPPAVGYLGQAQVSEKVAPCF